MTNESFIGWKGLVYKLTPARGEICYIVLKIFQRQLDAVALEEYKVRNHPVGACQIIITTDKTNNRIQEYKAASAAFSFFEEPLTKS